MKLKSIVSILIISNLSLTLIGCASTNNMSCNETRLLTPLVIAAQKHVNNLTNNDVIITPNC
jgi:hypothetical protein